MATVAIQVGQHPTFPRGWSRWKAHPVAMIAARIHARVVDWVRLEPRIDAWASYAALALAAAGTAAALATLRSF